MNIFFIILRKKTTHKHLLLLKHKDLLPFFNTYIFK